MKMKKILSMLTLATVLSSGVVAHAANDFTTIDPANSTQTAQKQQTGNAANDVVEGEIKINGKFEKTITNIPTPGQDGKYLRVTMPLSIDYTYNLDTNDMQSAIGEIRNESFNATGIPGAPQLDPQPIKMYFVGVTDNDANSKFELVDNNDAAPDKVGLPFKVTVTGSGASTGNGSYSLKSIKDQNMTNTEFKIGAASNIKLKIEKDGDIQHADLIKTDKTSVSHSLSLKFEYAGI